MPVTGKSDSALLYFQQGINMYYRFHFIEALASFEKSVRFDSGFAMGHWSKALSAGVSPENRALMDAMLTRYSVLYADALRASWDTRNSFDSSRLSQPAFMGVFMQHVYMTPGYLTNL
jgi:hypothetical protein